MFGEVVDGIDGHGSRRADDAQAERGVQQDTDLTADDLRELVETFKDDLPRARRRRLPAGRARAAAARASRAVFDSWNTPRAQVYRRAHDIPDDIGTAVNVVQMVFGNKGDRSGTGVAFTRNPSTGEQGLYGEFLANAQGEDVVAGIRTPQPLEAMRADAARRRTSSSLETMRRLEEHYRDMQDIEFTVEDGKLYLLQTRAAKRTAAAALKAAVDDGRRGPDLPRGGGRAHRPGAARPAAAPADRPERGARGRREGPERVAGRRERRRSSSTPTPPSSARRRGPVILVRWETTPDDIHGMIAAQGILTVHGGMTSHAAVVARGMGKPCVAGCDGLDDRRRRGIARIGGHELREGDVITIDGGTGRVYHRRGRRSCRRRSTRTSRRSSAGPTSCAASRCARTPTTPRTRRARASSAREGIGLCRTEHMFFGEERLPVVQEMILADDEAGRRAALDRLLPFQQADFEGIFEAMAGLPVTIRLLDPPLHEFLPRRGPGDRRAHARAHPRAARVEPDARHARLPARAACTRRSTRCRSARSRARRAPCRSGPARRRSSRSCTRSSASREELRRLRELTEAVWAEEAPEVAHLVGTMIELPRAAHARRRDRRARGLLLLRHERPDADDARRSRATTRRASSSRATCEDGVLERNPFEVLDQSTASAT